MSDKSKPTFIQRFEELEKTVGSLLPIIEQMNRNNNVLREELLGFSEQLEAIYEIAEKNGLSITVQAVGDAIIQKRVAGVEQSVQNLIDKGEVIQTGEITTDSVVLLEVPKANLARVLQKISTLEDKELQAELIGQKCGFTDSKGSIIVHKILELARPVAE
jgi:hypothetical protein